MGQLVSEESGNVYGKLTVLRRASDGDHNYVKAGALWLCKCTCGKTRVVLGYRLRNGDVDTCKRCNVRKDTKDEMGNRYNKLLVIGRAGSLRGHAAWLCRCDCGEEKVIIGTRMRAGKIKSCGNCYRPSSRRLAWGESAFNNLVAKYKRDASARGYRWMLSNEDVARITKNDCYICGVAPGYSIRLPRGYGEYIYNGIDRVNNNEGYTVRNARACCRPCNVTKGAMSLGEFKKWLSRAYNHLILNSPVV